ncbi:MAG: acetyltransferase [Cyclobacteriaceae bacterium]|nr:acetyltransferase [Cyclobacteriaceae bacterium]
MNKIAIIGAGGLGKEILVLIHQINTLKPMWNVVGFYDDWHPVGKSIAAHLVIGKVSELNKVDFPLHVVVAIADPVIKSRVVSQINNVNISFPTLIHPTATIGMNVQLGVGSVITAGCHLTIDIKIGEHVLVNLSSTIGHDAFIGSYSSIMPGVHISGFVEIEKLVLVGTGASILQNIQIGEGARIGAGAIVTKPVAQHSTVMGVPARVKD